MTDKKESKESRGWYQPMIWVEYAVIPYESEFCQQERGKAIGADGSTDCKYKVSCATVSEMASSPAK